MTDYKAKFKRDGFLVLPKFFAEQHIDAVQAAVKAKIAARPRDVVVDVLDTNERKLLSSLTPEQIRTTRMKVNDLYLNTAAVRDIAIDTDLAKILSDCMGAPIALCNSLYFEKGSAQPPHVDAIYMTPKTHGHLLASWVALEDVHEDAGPLEYYPGSQLIPQWKFSNGSYHSVPEEMGAWHAYMDAQLKERGLEKQSFAAKKGDVFIWHAHLLHGGGPINDINRTRRSLVFHYYTAADCQTSFRLESQNEAFWIRRSPQSVPTALTGWKRAIRKIKRMIA